MNSTVSDSTSHWAAYLTFGRKLRTSNAVVLQFPNSSMAVKNDRCVKECKEYKWKTTRFSERKWRPDTETVTSLKIFDCLTLILSVKASTRPPSNSILREMNSTTEIKKSPVSYEIVKPQFADLTVGKY